MLNSLHIFPSHPIRIGYFYFKWSSFFNKKEFFIFQICPRFKLIRWLFICVINSLQCGTFQMTFETHDFAKMLFQFFGFLFVFFEEISFFGLANRNQAFCVIGPKKWFFSIDIDICFIFIFQCLLYAIWRFSGQLVFLQFYPTY